MPDHPNDTWNAICRELKADEELTEYAFLTWLRPLALAREDGATLHIRAPDHVRSWVGERYLPVLRRAAARALGQRVSIELVGTDWRADEGGAAAPVPGDGGGALNATYTFGQFVIADGNRFAHAAALAVAEMPAQAYNPLFLYGRPGLGKTHLLHAIGNYVREHGGGLRVRYATVETFTNEFLQALRHGNTDGFKARFRGADVLLLDDVQFLERKAKTEEEFFHTFNALWESGSQLVMTSDRRPADIAQLAERLRERFEAGLVVGLDPIDRDARLAILRKRLGTAEVDDGVLAVIADHVQTNVRSLEGALVRVIAYASLRSEPPTAELAGRLLRHLYPAPTERVRSVEEIQEATASRFGISRGALLDYDRRGEVALARQVAMYLARELTDLSLPEIGRLFGGRRHSTVMHAHRRVSTRLGVDNRTGEIVRQLTTDLQATR